MLLEELFARIIETTALDEQIRQNQDKRIIKTWIEKGWKMHWKEDSWWKDSAIVVTNPEEIQKELMETYHNSNTAGHPGASRTFVQMAKDYWWPKLREYTRAYVKGCGTCEQNKANTHPNKPPINPIFPPQEAEPFKVISIDLITKLPTSKGNDTILTITDQGSTKGIILIPCKEAMGAEELATLYVERAFPYIGLLSKLISNRDTRFIGGLFREICWQLGIKQNISSAYHPETDGQSETNKSNSRNGFTHLRKLPTRRLEQMAPHHTISNERTCLKYYWDSSL